MADTLYQTDLAGLSLINRGKVRDIYDLGEHLLIVTTDRLSAFDVILPTPIPRKGEVLTRLSAHWFGRTRDLVPNHLLSIQAPEFPEPARAYSDILQGRSMLVRKARPLPVECIVRGYVSGSAWKEYQTSGTVCGLRLPSGLQESEKLPEPIFTPSTKAEIGDHDENISFERMEQLVGSALACRVRDLALAVYRHGAAAAAASGILVADTKMEFGILDDELILIDELLTPDSSRFWPADSYRVGQPQESLDKQYIRDYLSTLEWDKKAPGPALPPDVVAETSRRYQEILQILVGGP